MAWTEAQVPLLDPATDKFPDRFAPPSVAADKLAAAVSAAAALASEQTATTQAETATTQAGIATTQAGIATTQAGIATTQAETAATQAGISTTQAETATTQAGLAQTAARAASLSAGAADNSADVSAAQAAIATTQAGIATTQAETATTQAGIATTKAGEASTSASTATTKAGEAAASAAAALVSEQNAAATLANAVTKTTYDAKGDLLVGTGADAYTRLPAGANGAIPVADSASGTGLKWSTAAAAGIVDLASTQTITGAKTMTAPTMVAAVPAATFGADLTPAGGLGDAGWTLAGGATWAAPNLAVPSGGSLSCTIPVTSGKTYQIDVIRSASSGGDMTVAVGAASISVPSWSNNLVTVVAAATGSLTLTVGGGTWVATVQNIVCREVTATAGPALGYGAGQMRQSGTGNNALGRDAQRSLTTGSSNNALGRDAQDKPRGNSAWATTTASRQTAVGHESGQGSATPSDDIVTVGYRAIADGAKAMALGSMADARHAGSVALGSDTITTALAQVHVGPRHLALGAVTAPDAPAAGSGARLYSDVVGGKTRLVVRFAGKTVVLATED